MTLGISIKRISSGTSSSSESIREELHEVLVKPKDNHSNDLQRTKVFKQ